MAGASSFKSEATDAFFGTMPLGKMQSTQKEDQICTYSFVRLRSQSACFHLKVKISYLSRTQLFQIFWGKKSAFCRLSTVHSLERILQTELNIWIMTVSSSKISVNTNLLNSKPWISAVLFFLTTKWCFIFTGKAFHCIFVFCYPLSGVMLLTYICKTRASICTLLLALLPWC